MNWFAISENKLILDLINQQEISEENSQKIKADKFIHALKQHKLISYAYNHFDIKELIEKDYIQQQALSSLLMKEFQEIDKLFEQNNISSIPIKGISYLSDLYQPSERDLGDLDLLIKLKDYPKATSLLKDSGYLPEYELNNVARKLDFFINHAIEFKSQKTGVEIDLHWRLAERFILTPKFTEDFCKENQQEIKPEWQFLCLTIQAYKNNWQEIRGLLDIKKLCQSYEIDWKEVRQLSEKYSLTKITEATMAIVNKYLLLDIEHKNSHLYIQKYQKLQEQHAIKIEAYKYYVFADTFIGGIKSIFYRFCLPFKDELTRVGDSLASLLIYAIRKNIRLFLRFFTNKN